MGIDFNALGSVLTQTQQSLTAPNSRYNQGAQGFQQMFQAQQAEQAIKEAEKARKKQKRAGFLGDLAGLASNFIPGVGPFISPMVNAGVTDLFGGEVDYGQAALNTAISGGTNLIAGNMVGNEARADAVNTSTPNIQAVGDAVGSTTPVKPISNSIADAAAKDARRSFFRSGGLANPNNRTGFSPAANTAFDTALSMLGSAQQQPQQQGMTLTDMVTRQGGPGGGNGRIIQVNGQYVWLEGQ